LIVTLAVFFGNVFSLEGLAKEHPKIMKTGVTVSTCKKKNIYIYIYIYMKQNLFRYI